MSSAHLEEELARTSARVVVDTRYGPVTGGRALNGAAVFLEIPYALPPGRFENPVPLPPDFRYEKKEYITESSHAAQPLNDGQSANTPIKDKVGLGQPSENPLFINIVSPPSFPSVDSNGHRFPVKVYIHGGFLQFGSPHGLSSQAQFVSAERSEIWINIGYRLSVFGFLACDEPKIEGNFGFKDQLLALRWIKENVTAFGGDPDNIQLTGLSAGAHSVHQILHHISRLPPGENSPFHSAILQSNAIATNPKTPAELRSQFQALCHALSLQPESPDVLPTLRDPSRVPWSSITKVIESDTIGIKYGSFRGCLDGSWLASSPDPMTWQRSGAFAHALREKGLRSIVVGDLTEEWYLYSIAHPVHSPRDITLNIARYYPDDIVAGLVTMYDFPKDGATNEQLQRSLGDILSDGQVHLPVRMLARDLQRAGFPVIRYEIQWTPEQVRPEGYVTHGTDRPLWALRLPSLEASQVQIARNWHDAIDKEVKFTEQRGMSGRDVKDILTLKVDKTIGWIKDEKWDGLMRLTRILPGEA